MPLLRLTQTETAENNYRVEITLEGDGPRRTTNASFAFKLEPQDRADLRWYLEDYLQYPMDPAPQIAKRIEQRLEAIGSQLFSAVFQSNADAIKVWHAVTDQLNQTRVEIATDVKGASALPWELLRDPQTRKFVALNAQSFVRSHSTPVNWPKLPPQADKIRILLVICRPGGEDDVPFRSVAGKLLKSLTDENRAIFELDLLRPPTFEQLGKTLREAQSQGQPYHIVHFDGHGTYLNVTTDGGGFNLSRTIFSGAREGTHGYLLFENPETEQNRKLVNGPELGNLLVATGVSALVLNACRSAHADIRETPETDDDPHSQVRAFGSLAQEVMDTGVAGVVAMRYNVYVVTAAQFVADLYAALASGQSLGEAVSLGRKQLADKPEREIAFEPRPLQDWCVPLVYEAAPIHLFPRPIVGADGHPPLHIDITQTSKPADDLPRPDVGFFGRDETLLALDRAFDTQKIVLLHAYSGSGKTMTVAEFARWYQQTGGLDGGPILFTSFETYKPLERVLDTVEQVFSQLLQANNIQWLAMDTEQRKQVTFQILKQIPVLWIWDNVEPVNGFPAGSQSAWTDEEQGELRTFLQIMGAQTKAKFLLTSRRDERAWLGDLPRRVKLPSMPMQERVQLARALAEKHGRHITDVEDWRPLLAFTQGNPLTITVLVGQALRDGLKTKDAIREFVQKLRQGEAAFSDETNEGRSKSLGASLSYGFESAFSEDERKVLALLHFFQGFVDVQAFIYMADPEFVEWVNKQSNISDFIILPALEHMTYDTLTHVLDKAADIGLLTPHGGGSYKIHPALPWFFRALFEQYYPVDDDKPYTTDDDTIIVHRPSYMVAFRSFVESMGQLGDYYAEQYVRGNRDVISALRAEEANLLRARTLARQNGWYWRITSAMQGLYTLYNHTGRRAEWKHLVDEIAPDFVGADDLPLPGREAQWGIITQYRMWLAKETREWAEAERLQRVSVEWDRRNAAPLLARPPETLNANEKNTLRNLAASVSQLGNVLREQGKPECVDAYQDDYDISLRIDDKSAAAVITLNLGHAYKDLPTLRNLDEAERWYRRSLELRSEGDKLGCSKCYSSLGAVEYERFKDEKKANVSQEILRHYLNNSANYYLKSLSLKPEDDVNGLSVVHNQLGNIYNDARDLEHALEHWNQSIHYTEMAGNQYNAGITRRNVAIALANNGRLSDALLYARAALRNFEPYGQGAAEMIENTKGLIGEIEGLMAK